MYRDATPGAIYLKDYQPPEYLIDHVDLIFDLREEGTRVHSILTFRRNPAVGESTGEIILQGEGLELISLKLDGTELPRDAYQVKEGSLRLLQVPDSFELSSVVEISPEKNTALEGLYRSGGMFCTQCEAEGFRKITWYLDRPDVMAEFKVRIEADKSKYPVLLSNGNPVGEGDLEDGRHYALWEDPFPKPSYLFALVAGDLKSVRDTYQTSSGRKVELAIYVEPENIDKCDHAMRSLKNAMQWDEEKYGREYDLDVYNIVAVNDFNMGAMENKGLNIFNSKYVLARPDTATDLDFQGIEGVIAHEYFHNWTGNRITCRDWFQLSLKEGFTVFRDQEFSADMGSRGVKRIEDVRLLRSHQFAEDSGPMAHPVRPASYIEINNFYTVTVYEKGAEVVRMQANLLGPDLFRKATDLYFERHDGQAVTTDDFVQCMSDVSSKDLVQFKNWYEYAGTPVLAVTDHYDPESQTYELKVKQSVPDTSEKKDKPPFHIPFVIGLMNADGDDLPLIRDTEGAESVLKDGLLELIQKSQTFSFKNIPEKPIPSLLRGFSAPVKVEFDYSLDDLMFLMSHDTDGFNRWDASQTLSQKIILRGVSDRAKGVELDLPAGFITAFRNAILSYETDPALVAEVLSLPSVSYLGDQMDVVDIEGLFAIREGVKREIGISLHDDLLMLYEECRTSGDYKIDAASIGRRALQNRVLGYLVASGSEEAFRLCLDQYGAQHNMTDVMAAMALIADTDMPERGEILDDFAKRWSSDPLVMDKWFSVQAMSTRSDTLDRVQDLMSHPAFSIKNPNKVRSLIGVFANANPVRFHQKDGDGYRFLTDTVLKLDALNPQIAARLMRSMSRWRRFDESRAQLMKQELERVVATEAISRDLYEVAAKSLS